MKILNLAVIRLDGGTQARIALDNDKVGEYAEAMKEGHKFPPITTFYDGSDYWLADGFHRYHATRQTGAVSIEANAITGTVEEAQIYAFGANAKRGLSTTQEDNRSIITRMLSHPISSSWTNAEIARHVGVSSMTVGRVKASLEKSTDTQEEPKTQKTYTRNGKQVTIETKNIGRKKAEPEPQEDDERDQKIAELLDTVEVLHTENQRLKDVIAANQWDATDIERMDVQETIAELREQIKTLEIDNRALRDSRDMFQNRNAELMNRVKALQSRLKKLEPV